MEKNLSRRKKPSRRSSTPPPASSPSSGSGSSSVYTNPKLTQPRRQGRFFLETGTGFKKLQKEMAQPRPTAGLRQLPTLGLHDMLTCIRCGNIPNPKNYMVCDEGGHHLCGPCCAGPTKGNPRLKAIDTKKMFFPEKVLEACCAPANLRRGPTLILQALLDGATWKCPNEGNGCFEQFLGTEWDKHLESCKFRTPDPTKLRCFFDPCIKLFDKHSVEQLIQHCMEVHGAVVNEGQEVGVKMDFRDLLEKRQISLVKWKGYFVLACEVNTATEHLHVWVWSLSLNPSSSNEAATEKGKDKNDGGGGDSSGDQKGTEGLVNYSIKLIQVKSFNGVNAKNLVYEGRCLPPHPQQSEELMKRKNHFRIELQKVFNSCVESTPNGHGNLNLILTIIGKKKEEKK